MFNPIFEKLGKNKSIILTAALVLLNITVFAQIAGALTSDSPEIYFFDVGQGDSQLIKLPEGVQILIDGGPPNRRVLNELASALATNDRYIDLVILTHPQLDHFGGLMDVFKSYQIGALIWNGRDGTANAFAEFKEIVKESGVDILVLGKGDKIKHKDALINILSPDKNLIRAKDLNDTSIVAQLSFEGTKVLFTGDISEDVEKVINISGAHLLKVPHHGSKYSSSQRFLNFVKPKAAVIQVGGNSYGHPTKEVLSRLEKVGAQVFRNDLHGTIRAVLDRGKIKIYKAL